jgi:hypothetical protein
MSKKFDCVEMKYQMQEETYKRLKPKSIDDYFKKLIEYSRKANILMQLRPSCSIPR